MKKIFLKSLFAVTSVMHASIPRHLRYFIRDNYYSRLRQIKYFSRDYLSKKPYKVISYNGEFQQELTFVLPFAYWHYKNGTLAKTISAGNMSPFYFFSPEHVEAFDKRVWQNNEGGFEFPNMTHTISLSRTKWLPVPLKAHYKNDRFVFSKPLLVIANKYNIEWDGEPMNYFSIDMLNTLFNEFKNDYQIIYNRPPAKQIVGDNSDILDLGEHAWMATQHPEVIMLDKLYEEHAGSVINFNHLQLLVYANCDRFISVHGGTAAFASYFGGKNIILSKRGIEHTLNEFNTVFPALSGARIYHAENRGGTVNLQD
ncbi:MAG: hypothetical protein QM664_01385 [Flavihumibacter sp.]